MTADQRRLLEARWRLREFTDTDLHTVADELLSAGEDADALIRLFSLDRDQLRWEGANVFECLLQEWGGGNMNERDAVEIVVRHWSLGLIEGTVQPLEATSRADAINIRTAYQHDTLHEWSGLHEELGYLDRSGLSYLGRDRTVVEADVIALARSVVKGRS